MKEAYSPCLCGSGKKYKFCCGPVTPANNAKLIALIELAQIAHKQGRLDDAAMAYQGIINGWPNIPEAWNNLGTIKQANEKFEEAEHLYQQALKLKPNFGDAWNNLGTVQEQLSKLIGQGALLANAGCEHGRRAF